MANNPKHIFIDALEYASLDEQRRFLEQACADQPDLRSRVEALLLANSLAGNFLGGHSSEATTAELTQYENPIAQIGPYRLLEPLGEGGMGVVWLAEQHQPMRRQVALKLIKPGMDSRQVMHRFEAERQALSLMDHPNIAKVLDAGVVPAEDRRLETGGWRPEAGELPSKVQDSAHSLRPPAFLPALLCHGAGQRPADHRVL